MKSRQLPVWFWQIERQIVAKTIRIISPQYFGLCWSQFLQAPSGQTISDTNMPRERTDIDYPAEECWQCCVWWSAGSSLRISGFVSWIGSKSILDFNSSEKLQPPKSKSGVQVLLVGKSQGALRWLLERSDIIFSSTYMKSRPPTRARIFCLSNQGCQLSGWTAVGNEI